MRRYQRGFIVAVLGLLATTLVKLVGISSTKTNNDGFTKLSVSDVQREK